MIRKNIYYLKDSDIYGGYIMEELYQKFTDFMQLENKEMSVSLILTWLEKAESSDEIVKIYTNILARSLNEMGCSLKDKNICIWKEHIRSSIVRTILECAYPHIIRIKNKENNSNGKAVAVICPDGEYHEIGARMIADFFTLAGYNSTYVGASTPKEEFLNALDYEKMEIFALSVTNYYNLVAAKRIINAIKNKAGNSITIAVGGQAFSNNPSAFLDIGADVLLHTFEDIKSLNDLLISKEEK